MPARTINIVTTAAMQSGLIHFFFVVIGILSRL